MNSDIRVAVTCPDHPKVKKLMRRHGDIAFWNLIKFWSFIAINKPQGDLSGYDIDDLEIGAGWSGEPGVFYQSLVELRFVDVIDGKTYIHDWENHKGWACHAEKRSEKAKKAASARWEKRTGSTGSNAKTCSEQCNEHTPSNAPSPSPSPSPSPNPSPKEDIAPTSFESEPVVKIPLNQKGMVFFVTVEDIEQWQETFPGVDVLLELKRCRQWNIDNPSKRKTARGIRSHISSWLGRVQDKGGNKPVRNTKREEHEDIREQWAKELLEKRASGRGNERVVDQIQGPGTESGEYDIPCDGILPGSH